MSLLDSHLVGVVFAAVLGGTLGGCVSYIDLGFTCPDPDVGHLDANGDPDPCHRRDPDAGAACDGTCVPVSPPVTCGSNHGGQCSNPGETCAPDLPPPPPGFQVCITAFEDRDCFEPFPTKYVTYFGSDDGRSCTPCACNAPSASTCTGTISLFENGGCDESGGEPIGADEPAQPKTFCCRP